MITAAGVAAVCITVALLLIFNVKRFKRKDGSIKFASLLMLVGGLGVGGLVGHWLRQGGVWITQNLTDVGNKLIGYGIPLLVAIVLIGLFAIFMAKGHKPNKFTPWLGLLQFPLAAPLLPGAAGDYASSGGQQLFDAVQTFVISIFA